jgi:hypothetical protein
MQQHDSYVSSENGKIVSDGIKLPQQAASGHNTALRCAGRAQIELLETPPLPQ